VRAFLLANATAATLTFRLDSSLCNHLSLSGLACAERITARAVDEQRSQVRVATLAHAQQHILAAAGMLPGYQTQPGSHLPPAVKVLCIAQQSHQSAGRDRTDFWNLL
jgi:hypothetical protein